MRGAAWLGLAMVLLLSSPAAASSESCLAWAKVRVGTDAAEVDLGFAYGGEAARESRQEIDEGWGDGDGKVESGEVQKIEKDYTFERVAAKAACLDKMDAVQIAGKGPTGLAWFRKVADDTSGDRTDSRDTVYFEARTRWTFADTVSPAEARVLLGRIPDIHAAVACLVEDLEHWDWPEADCGADPDDPGVPTMYSVGPLGGATLDVATIDPSQFRALVTDGRVVGKDADQREALRASSVSFVVKDDGPSILGQPAWGVGAAGLALVAVAALPWMAPHARYAAGRWLWLLPGFSRLDRERALDHPVRESVLSTVRAQPGASLNDLVRATELPRGTLAHHLRMLERHDLVHPRRDGFRTRFFLRGPRIDMTPYLTAQRRRVLERVAQEPGLTQKELAARLGLPRKTLAYHTQRLAAAGQIREVAQGARRLYYAAEGTPASGATVSIFGAPRSAH